MGGKEAEDARELGELQEDSELVVIPTKDDLSRQRGTACGETGLLGVITEEPAFFEKGTLVLVCLLPRTERGVPVFLADLDTREGGGVSKASTSWT